MMADNHNTNEDEDILVTLDLDDGSQVECSSAHRSRRAERGRRGLYLPLCGG